MIKAIFFDVDGTLVSFRTRRIPDSTIRALHQLRERGIKLFVSTGRHLSMLDDVIEQFDFDGYVTVSGQYCLYQGEPIYRNPIPRQGVEEILDAARENGFSGFFLTGKEIYLNLCDEAAQRWIEEFHIPMPPVCDPRRALKEELYQVIVMLDREHEGLLLDRATHLKATRWHPTFIDVLSPNGGKDVGIGAVLSYLGLTAQEAMAFGDGENDISMLRYVGLGVAMGNASDPVKEQADYVTCSVDDNGVAAALEHFQLI